MSAKPKPFLCVIRLHGWAWVGRPGAPDSYRACRRCQKVHWLDQGFGLRSREGVGDAGGMGGDFGGGDGGGGD